MMSKKIKLIILFIILCISREAFSEDQYTNLAIGQFDMMEKEPNQNYTIKVVGLTMTLGQNFSNYYGFESKLFYSQSGSSGSVTLNTYGFGLYFNPHVELIDNLIVHAPVGIAFVSADRVVQGFSKETAKKMGFSYGMGMAYHLTDSLTITGDWMRYLDNANVGAPGVDIKLSASSLMLGASYNY